MTHIRPPSQSELWSYAEKLKLVADQYRTVDDADARSDDELVQAFAQTLTNHIKSGMSLEAAYNLIFDRLTRGVEDG